MFIFTTNFRRLLARKNDNNYKIGKKIKFKIFDKFVVLNSSILLHFFVQFFLKYFFNYLIYYVIIPESSDI